MLTLTASEGKYLTNGEVFVTSVMYDDNAVHIPYIWREVDEPSPEVNINVAMNEIMEVIYEQERA